MIAEIKERYRDLEQVCRRNNVLHLSVFGSAATGMRFTEDSDLDFLVEFQPITFEAYADAYFGLQESLERLFDRSVDLVVSSAISNPYFLQGIEETRASVYDARGQEISA